MTRSFTPSATKDRVRLGLIHGGWDRVIRDWFVRVSNPTTGWTDEALDRIVGSYLAAIASDIEQALDIDGSKEEG